jgi:hypothetical protein
MILHASLCVRDWISRYTRSTAYQRRRMAAGITVDGREATPDEVMRTMLDELAAGHERLPIGEPCEGFNYILGCPGHETREVEE